MRAGLYLHRDKFQRHTHIQFIIFLPIEIEDKMTLKWVGEVDGIDYD